MSCLVSPRCIWAQDLHCKSPLLFAVASYTGAEQHFQVYSEPLEKNLILPCCSHVI